MILTKLESRHLPHSFELLAGVPGEVERGEGDGGDELGGEVGQGGGLQHRVVEEAQHGSGGPGRAAPRLLLHPEEGEEGGRGGGEGGQQLQVALQSHTPLLQHLTPVTVHCTGVLVPPNLGLGVAEFLGREGCVGRDEGPAGELELVERRVASLHPPALQHYP